MHTGAPSKRFGTTVTPPASGRLVRRWLSPVFALAVLLGGLLAAPLSAQTVHGVVRDSDEQPLEEVYVAILDGDRRSVATTLTDRKGEFEVRVPRPGSFYLYVNRIGYHSLTDGPYALREDRPLEVWVVMHRDPIRMEGLRGEVEGRVERLAAVGFYERKETGWGHFIEREEFERKAIRYVTEAFRGIPRVRVPSPAPTLGASLVPTDLLNPQLLFRLNGRYCSPTLVIDGGEVHLGGPNSGPVRPDDWLVPQDVEAVEIYTGPVDVPIQYGMNSPCGLVMVWTKHTPRIGR